MNTTVNPTYTISGNKVFFLSMQNFVYEATLDKPLRKLLRKAIKNDYHLPENELVAMNRYIMKKDDKIDFNNVRSTMSRMVTIEGDINLLICK